MRLFARFPAGALLLAIAGCHPTSPDAPLGPDTTVTVPPVSPTLVDGDRRFRAECTLTPDAAKDGAPPTGRLTLSLVSEDAATSSIRWRRPIRETWGAYGFADCAALGYEVDHVSVATLAGTHVLAAHGPGGIWHFVDVANGAPVTDRLWASAATLPVHAGPLAVLGRERIAINAVPGHALEIRLRNDGPAIVLEPNYRHLDIEVEGADGWKRAASEPAAEGPLRVFARGETIELFVSAWGAQALQRASEARLVFLVYGLDRAGRPTRPARAIVPLPRASER